MASVHKRTWEHKGKEKSAWIVRYFVGEKQKQKTCRTKKEADSFAHNMRETTLQIGAAPEVRYETVGDLCEAFLRHSEDRHRDGRIGRGRLVQLNNEVGGVIRHLGRVKLDALTNAMVEEAYGKFQRIDGLAPMTAKVRVGIMKMVETWAIRRRAIRPGRTPVADAMSDLRGIVARPIRTFMADEVAVLLRTAATRADRRERRWTAFVECAVNLAAFCGLRYGEIVALSPGDIRFDRRMIEVRKGATHFGEIKGPKTKAGIRDVPMPQRVADLLGEWARLHYVENATGLMFSTRTGTLIHSANWHSKGWRPLLRRAGLLDGRALRFHALRHFAASWMIEHGLPIMEVATLMGHSKFDMTLQVYAHPVLGGSRRHDVMDRMTTSLLIPAGAVTEGVAA